jgi:hypothetical protein
MIWKEAGKPLSNTVYWQDLLMQPTVGRGVNEAEGKMDIDLVV